MLKELKSNCPNNPFLDLFCTYKASIHIENVMLSQPEFITIQKRGWGEKLTSQLNSQEDFEQFNLAQVLTHNYILIIMC